MAARRAWGVAAALVLWLAGCGAPENYHVWRAEPPASAGAPTHLTAWTTINEVPDWQANMLLEAAKALNAAGGAVALTVEGEAVDNNVYRARVASAAERGEAPDIVYVERTANFHELVDAGYAWPLDDCKREHPILADIRDEAWEMVVHRGQAWAVPASLNVRHLFYNKELLQELGWSPERIDALPADIRDGRFTFEDLMTTATEAIDAGVVAPGYGYWHYMGNRIHIYYLMLGGRFQDPLSGSLTLDRDVLAQAYRLINRLGDDRITLPFVLDSRLNSWSSRLAWQDAVIQNRVLFWLARSADWSRWPPAVTDPQILLDRFGEALMPAAVPGQPGLAGDNWTGFLIMSERATGRSNQAAACALLAQLAAPAAATYAMTGAHFPVLKQELPAGDRPTTYIARAQYIGDHALRDPTQIDARLDQLNVLLTEYADRVAVGNLAVDEAVAAAVEAARAAFGDELIVR